LERVSYPDALMEVRNHLISKYSDEFYSRAVISGGATTKYRNRGQHGSGFAPSTVLFNQAVGKVLMFV
jgi:hypothetical protein